MLDSSEGSADPELPELRRDAPELIGLETLPLDIIMLIVVLLDMQDMYRLRQVRKQVLRGVRELIGAYAVLQTPRIPALLPSRLACRPSETYQRLQADCSRCHVCARTLHARHGARHTKKFIPQPRMDRCSSRADARRRVYAPTCAKQP